jgi:hypothetical protein
VIHIEIDKGRGKEGGELRFLTNGEEACGKIAGVETRGNVMWLGDRLLMTTTREVEGLQIKLYELWTLSDDGTTLRIDAVLTTSVGVEDLVAVFYKK